MNISLEISMYPLHENYKTPILNFIEELNTHTGLKITTNVMSTQIFGEFNEVMTAFKASLEKSFIHQDKVVVVTKFFNHDLSV